jgi:RNA polymerase sigma factor (sigma-70 family)
MKLCLHRKPELWRGGKPLTEEQQKLVTDNIGLAYHLCGKKPIAGADRDENEAEALFCLTRAALNFNPEFGFKFSTFFWQVWINHRKDAMRESQMEVRGYFAPRCRLGQENMGHMEPIDQEESVHDRLANQEDLENKRSMFAILDGRARQVLEMRADGKSLHEIGVALGTTRERIRQIEKRSIFELQSQLGIDHDFRDKAIRELHAAQERQFESQKRYSEKVKFIKLAHAKHPNWTAAKISRHTGCSEQMVRKHAKFKTRQKPRVNEEAA